MISPAHSLGPHERLLLLRAITLPAQLPPSGLIALAEVAEERSFGTGDRLIDPGAPVTEVHVVVDGRVTVSEQGRFTYAVEARQVAGAIESLARVERGCQAVADEPTLTLTVPVAALLDVYEDHFAMYLDVLGNLTSSLLAEPRWIAAATARTATSPPGPHRGAGLVGRMRLLRLNDVLGRSRMSSLADLATELEEFDAGTGQTIWRTGDPAGWFLLVTSGRVDCRSEPGSTFQAHPGATLGFVESLAGRARWHDAIAAVPVTGFTLTAERFFDLLEDDFRLAADFLAAIAAEVRAMLMSGGQVGVPGLHSIDVGPPAG